MTKFWLMAAAGTMALGMGAASAQEMTIAGAQVLLTEIPGASACAEPSVAPSIPDGTTATEDEMNGAVGLFRDHMAETEEYQNCINAAALGMGDAITPEQNQAVTIVYDSHTERLQSMGEKFNEQIRVYNEANPD